MRLNTYAQTVLTLVGSRTSAVTTMVDGSMRNISAFSGGAGLLHFDNCSFAWLCEAGFGCGREQKCRQQHLQKVQYCEAGPLPPLQHMPALCAQDGPPLSFHKLLRGPAQRALLCALALWSLARLLVRVFRELEAI